MRTTGVKLVADLVQYKREMKEGAKATRDLKDEVDDVATASDKLGDGLAESAKKSNRGLDDMRKRTAELDRQIDSTQQGLARLAKDFADTGDAGILKSIREQKRVLTQLKSVRSLLPEPGEAMKAGVGLGSQLIGGIRTALQSASPASIGAGAVGVLLAPMVGAAVAGAVVGGAGLGGVAGGLILASRDKAVKDAAGDLGEFVLGDLTKRSRQFVPELLSGIGQARGSFAAIGTDLERIFASSRFVKPLIDGAAVGAKGFVKGFADAIDKADPVIDQLGETFAQLGATAGDFFSKMAGQAENGAMAIGDITDATIQFLEVTGDTIVVLSTVYGWISKVNGGFEKWTHGLSVLEALNPAAPFQSLYGAIKGVDDAQKGAVASGERYRSVAEQVRIESTRTAAEMGTLVAAENDVKEVQQASTRAQQEFTRSLELMSPKAGLAAKEVDGLRKATQALYGAQERGIDANESYEASWDALSDSVKTNKGTLDRHTAAGRANRDALEAMLSSSRDLYFADLDMGKAEDGAREKHENRTKAVREEARRLHLNKDETDKLIASYGRIPPKRQTDIVLTDIKDIVTKMMDLYVYQRSLAEGVPVGSIRAILNKEKGPAKKYGGYHGGGYTGDGGKYEPAGIVHRKEFVLRSEATSSIERDNPGVLAEMNATGQLPGHASGGWVGAAPVETSTRLPYRVNTGRTKIPSREDVASKVMPAFGDWPSSPSAQRGDSGVWRSIVRLIKGTGPMSGSFGNSYRPGDPLWHGSGRAVDWMGFNQDHLATFLAARRPLELIHRTRNRDYAYTRGVNKGSFNEGLMNAHRNHIHIAMKNGGMIREPIVGVGASGATYGFGEGGVTERVIPTGSGAGLGTLHLTVVNHGVIGSKAETYNMLSGAIDDLRRNGRI